MKELYEYERKELFGVQYNIIVATRFGTTLSSCSGNNILHSTPLLKSGIEEINSTRGPTTRNNQLSNKRRRR